MGRPEERDFAGFRIVRPLELGELASVWEAEDPETGDRVAIETLAGDAARDEDVSEWFSEAWELAADIDARGIVHVVEIGEQEGVPFAVRTPAGESTLAERLGEGGPLSPGAAVQVLTEIGEALESAHEAGVVHGALGPAVVVLDERGRAHLAGFGRAEGDRREDVRALGGLLVDMLGEPPENAREPEFADEPREREEVDAEKPEHGEDGDEPDADADVKEAVSAHELARADLLREIGHDGAGGEYSRASDLVAAAKAAKPGRREVAAKAAPGSGGRSRLIVAVASIAVVVVLLILLLGGGGDDDGDSSTAAQSSPSTTSTTPETSTSTTTAPAGGPSRPVPVRGFPVGVSARDGVVYAVTRDGGSLDGFDEQTGTRVLGPVQLPGSATDVTVVDGVAWVTLGESGAIASIDLSDNQPFATSLGVGGTLGPIIGALGSIWTIDVEGKRLLELPQKLTSGTVPIATDLDADEPVALTYGAGSLWVSDAKGKVLRIDPKDPTKQESFEVDGSPGSALVVEDQVWLTDEADGSVIRLDPESGKTVPFPVGGSPRDLAADPEHLWALNGDGYVTSILLDTGATEQIDLSGAGGSPQAIAVGQQVWVTTGSGNTLVAIAPASS